MIRLLLLMLTVLAAPANAAPTAYDLKIGESRIDFTYDLQGSDFSGNIPIRSADVVLDFQQLSRSEISVEFGISGVTAGFAPLTEAIKSQGVLNARQFPAARFRSRSVRRSGDGAVLSGDLTLKGVTRPVQLNAQIFRERGSEPGDLTDLIILLTGSLDRREFGASGYAGLVGPAIDLRVLVAIVQK